MKKHIRSLVFRIRSVLLKWILQLKKFNSSESIIIFSEARGGSTWLMEILSTLLPVSINWEPLHVDYGVVPREKNFGWTPFIPADDSTQEYHLLFQNIHAYKIHTKWTRQYLSFTTIFKSKYVLTKYVRANLLLPYLTHKFDFNHQPIFLIRHPIDTCLSQLRAFKNNDKHRIKHEVPKWINNDRFIKHAEFLGSLASDLEVKVANWCLNNCPTIEIIDPSKVCVVFYSDLLLKPEQETRRILIALGLDRFNKNLKRVNFRKPSRTDFKRDFKPSPQIQLNKNIKQLDIKVKHRIQSIFDYFEFDLYSAYSSEPNKQRLTKNKA